jgi:hypothetical protein
MRASASRVHLAILVVFVALANGSWMPRTQIPQSKLTADPVAAVTAEEFFADDDLDDAIGIETAAASGEGGQVARPGYGGRPAISG